MLALVQRGVALEAVMCLKSETGSEGRSKEHFLLLTCSQLVFFGCFFESVVNYITTIYLVLYIVKQ